MARRRSLQVLVTAVVSIFLLVLSGTVWAQGNSGNAFDRVKEVQERHTASLMAKANVVGTAVGVNDREQPAVLVLLEKGGAAGIPQQLEGIPVHPVVTGTIVALKPPAKPAPGVDPTARFDRPVPIGVSTGHPAITAGTIGCRVKDASGNVFALSNNHVYADENNASIGAAVIQPGTYDGGTILTDIIGNLSAYQTISFGGSANTIDAAIALSTPLLLGNATPSNGYGKPSSTPANAFIRQAVQKYGRTTSLTKGKVYALNATVNVGYDGGTALFVGQIVITPGTFSAGGDSGSLIVTQSGNNPVGLLFAGSNSVTIANPIDLVLSRFDVTVDGQ